MKLASHKWLVLESVGSTQDVAAEALATGQDVGIVFAHRQTRGKGRFDRPWISAPHEALTISMILTEHPRPHLVGMACALAVAEVIDSQIQWPNDLVFDNLKVGGVLTSMLPDAHGRKVPVVGIGLNLNQTSFPPEISARATSLHLRTGALYPPVELAKQIIERIEAMPTPNSWIDLSSRWSQRDATRGKKYQMFDGRRGTATGIGSNGELISEIQGQQESVFAADALFGPS